MKKGCIVLGILISMLLFACSPEKGQDNIRIDTKPHQLNIDKTSISLGASSNLTADAKVTAENTGWEFSNIPSSWLEVKPSSGKTTTTVNITAQANTSVDETRIHVMQFHSTETDYNYSRDISVSQAAATVSITPNETSFGCEAAANSKTIGIDANVEWDAECAETWLTLTKSKTQLTISATENLGTSRTTTILLKRAGTSATVNTITVTQSEANVTGSTETLNFDVNGESKELPITAGASWTAYTSDDSWLSVTPAEGKAGAATLIVSTTANASSTTRSGFVYVKIGDNKKLSIPVQQEKMSISIEGIPQTIDGDGTKTCQLSVVSTSQWTVISKPEWLTITPDRGEAGTTNITASAGKNTTSHYRQGNIVLGIPNTNVTTNVYIEQAGISTEGDLIFAWNENKQTLRVSSTSTWNAMTSAEWITLSQYAGTGTIDITVYAATNDDEDVRNGTITFISDGGTKEIAVHQDGQYLKIDEMAGVVSAMGGTISIAVNTTVGAQGNIEYAGTAKNWIQMSNNGANVYRLAVNTNPSQYPRSAKFNIKPTMATTNQAATAGIKYTINQNGRSLSASVNRIEFSCQGGTSNICTIQADGDYDIQKDAADTWYVLQHKQATRTFTIIASENTNNTKREGRLTLSLKNMPDGETKTLNIPVIQFRSGLAITIEGFGEDNNWNK